MSGLEYLHGLWVAREFHALWAHDRAGEGEALRKFLAFFEARLRESPEAHIYHYAAYKVTALKRLTVRHGIGEAFLDRLQRERRFVARGMYRTATGQISHFLLGRGELLPLPCVFQLSTHRSGHERTASASNP